MIMFVSSQMNYLGGWRSWDLLRRHAQVSHMFFGKNYTALVIRADDKTYFRVLLKELNELEQCFSTFPSPVSFLFALLLIDRPLRCVLWLPLI